MTGPVQGSNCGHDELVPVQLHRIQVETEHTNCTPSETWPPKNNLLLFFGALARAKIAKKNRDPVGR